MPDWALVNPAPRWTPASAAPSRRAVLADRKQTRQADRLGTWKARSSITSCLTSGSSTSDLHNHQHHHELTSIRDSPITAITSITRWSVNPLSHAAAAAAPGARSPLPPCSRSKQSSSTTFNPLSYTPHLSTSSNLHHLLPPPTLFDNHHHTPQHTPPPSPNFSASSCHQVRCLSAAAVASSSAHLPFITLAARQSSR